MTIVEFFEQVPKNCWFFRSDGAIRRRDNQCPITALENLNSGNVLLVGERHGLDRSLIVIAADNEPNLSPVAGNYRQRMIELFNLPQSLEVIPK